MGPLRGLYKTKFEVGASFYIAHHFKLINLSFSAVFNSLSFLDNNDNNGLLLLLRTKLYSLLFYSLLYVCLLAGINILTCMTVN